MPPYVNIQTADPIEILLHTLYYLSSTGPNMTDFTDFNIINIVVGVIYNNSCLVLGYSN